jgi:hypothetical protein
MQLSNNIADWLVVYASSYVYIDVSHAHAYNLMLNYPEPLRTPHASKRCQVVNHAHFFPNPKNFFIFASKSPPPLPFPLPSFFTPSGFCAEALPSA